MRRKNVKRSNRRTRQRRVYRRKRNAQRQYTKPDGYHSAKIVQRLPLVVNNNPGLTNAANCIVAWYQPEATLQPTGFWVNGVSCAHDWHTISNSTSVEWLKLNNLFIQSKVTGLKIKYEPQNFQSSGDKSQQPITVFTSMRGSSYNTSSIQIERQEQSLDFKTFHPFRPFKRYYHVAKYLRTVDQNQWFQQGVSYDAELNPWTHIVCPTTGFNTGDRIGTIELTYYMKFRQQSGV